MLNNLLNRAKARKSDEGFTLIELLIVIIILGVLAAIVVFSVRGITNNSKKVACDTAASTVNTAIEAYWAQSPGTVVDSIGDLVTAGVLHADSNYTTSTGTTVTIGTGGQTLTLTPGTATVTATAACS